MLRLDLFKAFLCFALLQIYGVAARPQPLNAPQKRTPTPTVELRTNAARMAAGLSPLQPRQLYNPARIQARSSPSPAPYSGTIKVVEASNGNIVGWVGASLIGGASSFGTVNTPGNRLSVSFSSSSQPFNIAVNQSPAPFYPYVGFTGGLSGSDLESTGSTMNGMTEVHATAPGSTAQGVGNFAGPPVPESESAIWFFDPSSKELTAKWVNSNDSPVASHFWLSNSALWLVGNTAQSGGFEVKFYLD